MRPNVFNFTLDTMKTNIIESIKVVSGDNKMNLFLLEIEQNGIPFDLTDRLVLVTFLKNDGTAVIQTSTDETRFGVEENIVRVIPTLEVTSETGRVTAEVSVFGSNEERITTQKFSFNVRKSIMDTLEETDTEEELLFMQSMGTGYPTLWDLDGPPMSPNTYTLTLDTIKKNEVKSIKIVSGDNKMNLFLLEIEQNGIPFDLTDKIIAVVFVRPDGTQIIQSSTDLTGLTVDNNIISVIPNLAVISQKGRVKAEVAIYGSLDERVTTQQFSFNIREPLMNEQTSIEDEEFLTLMETIGSDLLELDGEPMNPNTFILELDTIKKNPIDSIKVVSGDSKMNLLVLKVEQNGIPFSLIDRLVTVTFAKSDGTQVTQSSTDETGFTIENNVAKVVLDLNTIAHIGRVLGEVSIYGPDKQRVTTQRFHFDVREPLANGTEIESTTEYPLLLQIIDSIEPITTSLQEWLDNPNWFIGPEGPIGPQGEPGIGIEIVGSLETINDLPLTGSLGAGYLIEGDLWIWTEDGYENVGHIQGPKGDKGERGPVGPVGTLDYTDLLNRPSIQSIELIGNKTFEELGITPISQEEIVNIL